MTWQGAIITGVFGVLTAVLTAHFARKQKKPEQHTADWSTFTREMREWTEQQLEQAAAIMAQQLADRDREIGKIRQELSEVRGSHDALRVEHRELRGEHHALKGRYTTLAGWSRYLYSELATHRDPTTIRAAPPGVFDEIR